MDEDYNNKRTARIKEIAGELKLLHINSLEWSRKSVFNINPSLKEKETPGNIRRASAV